MKRQQEVRRSGVTPALLFSCDSRGRLTTGAFTVAAVLALGLGIGLNNAVFTIVNTAMFKELPFDEADRLVELRLVDMRGAAPNGCAAGTCRRTCSGSSECHPSPAVSSWPRTNVLAPSR